MPSAVAVAEGLLDPPRLVVQAEDHFGDLRHLAQLIELVHQEGAVEDRDDGFGRVERERSQARALATCQKNGLHVSRE